MQIVTCCRCRTEFFLPDELYGAAKRSPGISVWCPYGHEQHFPAGETDLDIMRRERDQARQQIARAEDAAAEARAAMEKAERKTKRLMRRVSAGVCPCCNRTFSDLARHMKTKHENVVSLKKAEA